LNSERVTRKVNVRAEKRRTRNKSDQPICYLLCVCIETDCRDKVEEKTEQEEAREGEREDETRHDIRLEAGL